MRKWLLILFLLQYKINITAQVSSTSYNNIDSFKVQLAKQTEDKRKVYLYSEISNFYVRIMPDSAYYYALQGMKLAQKINDIKGENYCRISMAQTAWGIGDYLFAIKLILPQLKEIEGSKDTNLIVLAYMVLFNTYRDQGDFKEASKYDLHIIEIMIKSKGEPPRISLAALAGLYLKTGKIDSAGFFLRWAFKRPPDPGIEGWPKFIAGEFFKMNGNKDSALAYYRQSIDLLSTENNFKDMSGTYNSMAELFRKNK